MNFRISEGYCAAGPVAEGVELGQVNKASSKQFMHMTEEVLPGMVEAGVKAAVACATLGVAGSAAGTVGGACDIMSAIKSSTPEVPTE